MHLNDLPGDCLLLLFGNFSLQEQIKLRLICQQWRHVLELHFQRKTSLKLFGSLTNVRSYIADLLANGLHQEADLKLKAVGRDDDLMLNVAYFDGELCQLLYRLFPNVDKLLLCFGIVYPFCQVPTLLQHWTQLSSLALCGLVYPPDAEAIQQIGASLGRYCPNLKRLHLLASNLFHDIDSIDELRMGSVLPRLSHLSLNNFDGDLAQVLIQLDANCCEQLSLNYPDVPANLVQQLLSSSLCLTNKIKCLRIGGLQMNNAKVFMNFLAINFLELQCLKIDFGRYPVINLNLALFEELEQLTQLAELQLTTKYDPPTGQPVPTSTLPSVTTLHMTLLDSSHLNVEHFIATLSSVFPQLAHLSVCHPDGTVLEHISQHMSAFSNLQSYRLFSRHDEFDYLGRHVDAAMADDNKFYSSSIIRRVKAHKLQLCEKIDLNWQRTSL